MTLGMRLLYFFGPVMLFPNAPDYVRLCSCYIPIILWLCSWYSSLEHCFCVCQWEAHTEASISEGCGDFSWSSIESTDRAELEPELELARPLESRLLSLAASPLEAIQWHVARTQTPIMPVFLSALCQIREPTYYAGNCAGIIASSLHLWPLIDGLEYHYIALSMCASPTKSGPWGANAVGEEHLWWWCALNAWKVVSWGKEFHGSPGTVSLLHSRACQHLWRQQIK